VKGGSAPEKDRYSLSEVDSHHQGSRQADFDQEATPSDSEYVTSSVTERCRVNHCRAQVLRRRLTIGPPASRIGAH
jgi:hypothetical protein